MGFTHLQVRSGYSLMKSSITIDKLVKRAQELNFEALALTDENVMYGAVSFYQACKNAGIRPIIGLIVHVNSGQKSPEPCILLAKNNEGYRNLLALSTHLQFQGSPSIDKRDLSVYTAQVIGILPIKDTLVEPENFAEEPTGAKQHFTEWSAMFGDTDFYIGIQAPEGERDKRSYEITKRIAKLWGFTLTAIQDVRYLDAADAIAFDCLQAIKSGNKWSPAEMDPSVEGLYLKSSAEMEKSYDEDWVAALNTSEKIAGECRVELNLENRMIPSYPVPDDKSASNYLRELCNDQLPHKYGQVTEEAIGRLEYELDIIQSMQFSDYFLIVWDFIRFAKESDILVGPGRGSAAGSIVAFLLGITDVDPLKYDLLFERFLNPERVTMPDIDIDFSDHRRDEVIQYVKNKYGQESVAQIITFGTFATRSLLRELIKTMDVDQQDAAYILKEIPVNSAKSVVESVKISESLSDYVQQSEKLQYLFKVAAKLEGLPRHISTHAAGVVISEKPLVQHVPLTTGHNEVALTQYAMNELEAIGLLKMDFLGLRNLTLMERILASIRNKANKQLALKKIPFDDPQTFALLQEGKTNGIFQLESSGMQRVLTNLKPTHFEDVVAVNALFRPGPMEYIPVYVKRKHGQEAITYPHEDLKPILQKTYGVLVYQEQIMQIANKMAGFSLGQADVLRRAVSKKQKVTMAKQQQDFIQGCLANGYKKKIAEELFEWIVRFSNYGFNRSHAVAYSMISYQLAYLKTHYPNYFLAELMSSITNQEGKLRLYVKEAKGLGMQVLPPSINKSFGKFIVEQEDIRMGFMSVKGVGNQAVNEIIRARKDGGVFKHLFDFCMRVSFKSVNRQTIEALILAGAFDETLNNRATLLATIDQAMEQGELFREFDGQPSFFKNNIELDVSYIETDPFSQMKVLTFEKEVLGVYISSHPLADYRKELRANGRITLDDSKRFIDRKHMESGAVVQEIKKIRTKRGDPMAFLTLGDESGEVEAVVFPELYRNINRWLKEEMLVFIKGKVERRNDRIQWLLSEVNPFEEKRLSENNDRKLFVKLTKDNNVHSLAKIKEIASHFPGNTPVIIYHAERKNTYQLASDYNIKERQESLKRFYDHFGKENVAMQSKPTNLHPKE